jgi:geranylgeranyl pyrophosphate synthase
MQNTVHTEENTIITLAESRTLVDQILRSYFEERLELADTMDSSFRQLWQTIHTLFEAGGKRLRPYITLLSYQAFDQQGGNLTPVLPAAAAQELLHIAMLIHDDIIDRDVIRYGIANVAGQYDELYTDRVQDANERDHFSRSSALLAGDLLLSDAYNLLRRCQVDPALILHAQGLLNDAIFTVIGGELLDTEASFSERSSVRPLAVARFKTASYSFVSPLLVGASFAGAPQDQRDHLRNMGESLGIAYQLQDDLLGMFGCAEVTGKSVTSDLAEGKYTHLIELFYSVATESQKELYESIAGRGEVTPQDADTVRRLLTESGARAELEAKVQTLHDTALTALGALAITPAFKESFVQLIDMLVKRDK